MNIIFKNIFNYFMEEILPCCSIKNFKILTELMNEFYKKNDSKKLVKNFLMDKLNVIALV